MSEILDRIDWKLRRAAAHSNAADELAKAFLKSNHYGTTLQVNPNGRFVYKITNVEPFPLPFSVYVGEAAHQLRSTLNHIMYAIAKPTTPREEQLVEFPLLDRRRKWRRKPSRRGKGSVADKMPNIPRGVKTLVERLQPYHHRKWPYTILLHQIQIINNLDKHRALLIGRTASEGVDPCFDDPSGEITEFEVFDRVFKPGAVLIRGTMQKSSVRSKVNMAPEIHLLPVFDTGMPREIRRQPVIRILGRAGEFIRETVVPMFKPFL